MSTRAMRCSTVRWVPFVVLFVAITAGSLSSSVAQWWAVQSNPGTSSLPAAADPVLRARTNSADADVHTVLWFAAALALVWAMRHHRRLRLVAAAAALWVYTGLLEVSQRWVQARMSQWIDLAGNGLGIVAGLAVGCGAMASWRRFATRAAGPMSSRDPRAAGTTPRSGVLVSVVSCCRLVEEELDVYGA